MTDFTDDRACNCACAMAWHNLAVFHLAFEPEDTDGVQLHVLLRSIEMYEPASKQPGI